VLAHEREPVKWLVFVGAVLAVYPFGRWLRGRPGRQSLVWSLVGFLPFFYSLDVALVVDRIRPGDAHGIEVALIDLLALALFVARPRPMPRVPYRGAVLFYVFAAAASIAQAASPGFAFFYVWKLLRMCFLGAVLMRAGQEGEAPAAVLRGMTVGTLYEFGLVLWQRYGLGMNQVTGSFAHQNSLGMAVNLVVMASFALVLARRTDWRTTVAPFAAMVTIVLTLSRGALALFAVGLVLVFLLSMLRGVTTRKVAVALLGAAVAAAVLAKGADTIVRRFGEAPAESMEERRRLDAAALMMVRDHPLGVGANHFTWMLVNRGYGERAGLDPRSRTANVHNIYWLTAAEMGYPGLLALLALMAAPLVHAFRYVFSARGDARGDVLLGLGVGLVLCWVHGTIEWVWRTTEISYLFWMIVAMVPALARQLAPARPALTNAGP
jgi:O-antigen ligase